MSSIIIYLDESGDLGWKFSNPYRRGGSSRFLTIASLVVTPEKRHLPKRLIRKLYNKFKWRTKSEKKWSDLTIAEREFFATKAADLCAKEKTAIRYLSITVRKENVQSHIRSDPNKLYNYMIGLSLLHEMSHHDRVEFIPDQRSIKIKSGNSLHDYLQTKLWFDKSSSTILNTTDADSSANYNLQFADMLCGIVQGHFEDSNSSPWAIIKDSISYKTLFF